MSFGDLKVQDLIYEDSSNNEITVVIADLATKANPTFTGTVTVPTAPASDVSTKAASTAFVDAYYATKAAPAFTGSATGVNLTLSGNLVVNGTTTTINTQTLDVEDINITLGKVSIPSDTTANNGGITLKGASDKTFNWLNATDAWTSSEHLHLLNTKNLILGTDSHSTLSYLHGSATTRLINRNTYIDVVDNGTAAGSINLAVDGGNQFFVNERGFVAPGLGTVGMQWAPTATQDIVLGIRGRGTNTNHLAVVDLTSSHASVGGADVKYGKIRFSWDNTSWVSDHGTAMIEGCSAAASQTTNRSTGLKFYTAPMGAAGSYAALPVERLRIWKDGQLGIGGANYGTSGQVLTSGGASAAPSWTSISAAPEVELVADGAISANEAVIVKSNGKAAGVTAISESLSSASDGTVSTSNNNIGPRYLASAWDSANSTMVHIWCQQNGSTNTVMAVAATLSGSSWTWGTAVGISNQDTSWSKICSLGGNKFVGIYDENGVSKSLVLSVSGTTISQGTKVNYSGGDTSYNDITALSSTTVVVVYKYEDNNYGYAQVGTISGTSISWGSASVRFHGGAVTANHNRVFKLSSTSVIISSTRGTPSPYSAKLFVGTVSGTSITLQEAGWDDYISNGRHGACLWDATNNRGVVVYANPSGSPGYQLQAKKFTISGTTVTVDDSSLTTIWSNEVRQCVDMDVDENGIIFLGYMPYAGSSYNNNLTIVRLDISGSTVQTSSQTENVSSGGGVVFQNQYQDSSISIVHIGSGKFACSYGTTNSGGGGKRIKTNIKQFPSTDITSENFIGFATSAIADTATGKIAVTGNTSTQSSLTPGQKYYVQNDGSLSTTAATPNVEAGIALTSTKLLIKG